MTRQLRKVWLYIILLVSFFFLIDKIRFDLLNDKILKFYFDEFLHFTKGFEFNLYAKDMKK